MSTEMINLIVGGVRSDGSIVGGSPNLARYVARREGSRALRPFGANACPVTVTATTPYLNNLT